MRRFRRPISRQPQRTRCSIGPRHCRAGIDGLGRSGEARGRSAGDDRSATVNYPILSNLKDTAALREMMGRAVESPSSAMSSISPIRSGSRFTFAGNMSRWPVSRFRQCGIGDTEVVETAGRTDLHALPRIAWTDGSVRPCHARDSFRHYVSAVRRSRLTHSQQIKARY